MFKLCLLIIILISELLQLELMLLLHMNSLLIKILLLLLVFFSKVFLKFNLLIFLLLNQPYISYLVCQQAAVPQNLLSQIVNYFLIRGLHEHQLKSNVVFERIILLYDKSALILSLNAYHNTVAIFTIHLGLLTLDKKLYEKLRQSKEVRVYLLFLLYLLVACVC